MQRLTRALWSFLALVLSAIGIAGLLAGLGVLGSSASRFTLLPAAGVQLWQQAGVAAEAATAAAGVLLAVLGALLLWARLRPAGPRFEDLRISGAQGDMPSRRGLTVASSSTITNGAQHDLERLPAVLGARVHLAGRPEQWDMSVRLDVRPDVDLAQLQRGFAIAMQRLAQTTGTSPQQVDVTLRLRGRPAQHRVS